MQMYISCLYWAILRVPFELKYKQSSNGHSTLNKSLSRGQGVGKNRHTPLSWVAFGILIIEAGAQGLECCLAAEVLW